MKNKNIVLISLCLFSGLTIAAQNKTLIPITTRVDIQGSVAPQTSVIDGEWDCRWKQKRTCHTVRLYSNIQW